MSSVNPSPQLSAFVDWCKQQKCDLSNFDFVSSEYGYSVVANQNISAESSLCSIPFSLCFSVAYALGSAVGKSIIECPDIPKPVSARVVLYINMIAQKHDPDSNWYPYFSVVPESFTNPLYWNEEELEFLNGTQMIHEVYSFKQRLKHIYDTYFQTLSRYNPKMFPYEQFTYSNLLWARSVLSSRCFHEDMLPDSVKKDNRLTWKDNYQPNVVTDDCPAMLCPLFDMMNHSSNVFFNGIFDLGDENMGISVKNTIEAGQKVQINYGDRRSHFARLLGFGFCLEQDSELDFYPLLLSAPASLINFGSFCGVNLSQTHHLTINDPVPEKLILCMNIVFTNAVSPDKIVELETQNLTPG
eukprot:TRINITY_DN5536_c0_g1_i1.p1 TRINITY_DN5536_c0_g1~~TRINITY_DN5536_c0_g1_i1.p1  ORF type:complete len:356 (-),score=65.83 TRINITY_DN5536_c0_g1_i1:52-1119(-)